MPNRYGEPPQPDEPDNTDHAAAAQRGMNHIRTIMGWKTPKNPPQNQPDPKNRTP